MLDRAPFRTAWSVFSDDCGPTHPRVRRPGPTPALSARAALTLLVFAPWRRLASRRDFYRSAPAEVGGGFPRRPARSQFLRPAPRGEPRRGACLRELARQTSADQAPDQVRDRTPVRDAKRRGRRWLDGQAARGHRPRRGWFFGFQRLLSGSPAGVITGFALAPGNPKEQPLATAFLQARAAHLPRAETVGAA